MLSCLDFVEKALGGSEPREMWDEVGSSQPPYFRRYGFWRYAGNVSLMPTQRPGNIKDLISKDPGVC